MLNDLHWLICHKPNQTKSYIFNIHVSKAFGIKWLTMVDMP